MAIICFPSKSIILISLKRDIVYLVTILKFFFKVDMKLVAKTCNAFRTYNDIEDDWTSIHNTLKYLSAYSEKLANVTGPGKWNDPDQVRYFL